MDEFSAELLAEKFFFRCKECGSEDVSVRFEPRTYGADAADWLIVECSACKSGWQLGVYPEA